MWFDNILMIAKANRKSKQIARDSTVMLETGRVSVPIVAIASIMAITNPILV